ncbi:MAG: hypothetical protein K6G11_07480 [Lachnospiraceae bacterium]|nr:hypothetical protein [Lachnospiraceae bacterium]
MDKKYLTYLMERMNILVCENNTIEDGKESLDVEGKFALLYALKYYFNIDIVEGYELVNLGLFETYYEVLYYFVPEPFYKGFPESVKKLSPDQRLFDQKLHYAMTYGFGYTDEAGHSIFEGEFTRSPFNENMDYNGFSIVTEEKAVEMIKECVNNLIMSTRMLSNYEFDFIFDAISDYNIKVDKIASKQVVTEMLCNTRDLRFADYLYMSDVIRVVECIQHQNLKKAKASTFMAGSSDIDEYFKNNPTQIYKFNKNAHRLNLSNKNRKFITALIDKLFENGKCDLRNCYEKKKAWNGLLHHIHYKAKTEEAQAFLDAMRGKENHSVYSDFEKAMSAGDIKGALDALKKGKGSSAVLRNLVYIVSRCENVTDIQYVLDSMDSQNSIVLIQLLLDLKYRLAGNKPRDFKFTKNNIQKVHKETPEEQQKRKSNLSTGQIKMLSDKIFDNLKNNLKDKLGKVYIEPGMDKYALPLQEEASSGGLGVLPKGTRLPIKEGKKIRAFTYWEGVDDIDLSFFCTRENGRTYEYSWRTMNSSNSDTDTIIFSGDETSGYNGGSEYFDIDIHALKKEKPDYKYIIFCDNIYSDTIENPKTNEVKEATFSNCFCKAGYMLRDIEDSGEIFEPKTVKSSFQISSDSNFSMLFGIDLEKMEFVWLNVSRSENSHIAGTSMIDYVTEYFHITEVMNMEIFFKILATEVVENPEDADVIVTDKEVKCSDNREVIHHYDIDRMIALLNS